MWSELESVSLTAMEDPIYRRLGEIVAERRQRAGLRQQDLADRVRLSRTSIVNIEKGRQRVAVHHLYAIAAALAVTPADLLPPANDVNAWVAAIREEIDTEEEVDATTKESS